MPIDPKLLDRVLSAPRDVDIATTPVVTALVLQDPANAEILVPFLDDPDSTAGIHARQILCRFDRAALPFVMRMLADDRRGPDGRASGLDVVWSVLMAEEAFGVRAALRELAAEAGTLLDDRRPIPDRFPEFVERDFVGRVCDRAYLVLAHLIEPKADLSVFRAADHDTRDQLIRRLRQKLFGGIV